MYLHINFLDTRMSEDVYAHEFLSVRKHVYIIDMYYVSIICMYVRDTYVVFT